MFSRGVEMEHWLDINQYHSLFFRITENFGWCQYAEVALEVVIIIIDTQNERSNAIISKSLNFNFSKDIDKLTIWAKKVSGGRDFEPSDHKVVCSNHFVDGKPSHKEPNPTLNLVPSDIAKPSPRKCKTSVKNELLPFTLSSKVHVDMKTEKITMVMPVFSVPYTLLWSFQIYHDILLLSFMLNSKTVKFSKFSLAFLLKKASDIHWEWKGINWKVWLILFKDLFSPRDKNKVSIRTFELE